MGIIVLAVAVLPRLRIGGRQMLQSELAGPADIERFTDTVRETARRMLEAFGFSVIDAEDGQAGAAAFAENADRIVLTLVDMTMPKMNGEETFRAIRRIRAEAPVILTSGYNEIEATRRFVSRGLAGFLEKPFTPADLANKLSAVLGPSSS